MRSLFENFYNTLMDSPAFFNIEKEKSFFNIWLKHKLMSQRKNEELKKVFAFFSTCYPRWSAKLVPCKRTPEIDTRDYDRLTESM